ncbi:hypothetical protein NP493_462g02018 [Ridgeia piscesae]|uniref:G-protein coupled receptors family 1 profile domain-containing protein n=1 Tax=Ridgeia piscesae TaxID=27915 RepID=A0AAD9KZ57_RIDPI|nr:hypothetical protein NP493_462g02018 [Ridgeia piscesae]
MRQGKTAEDDAQFPETHIAHALFVYASPMLLAWGTLGNVLCAIVLARMSRRALSTCVYVVAANIADLALLHMRIGNDWLGDVTGVNARLSATLSSHSVCKLYPFVSGFLAHLTTWLVACIAAELAIVTARPQRLLAVCKTAHARIVIMLVVVVLICVNAHCFWTWRLMRLETRLEKGMVCTNVRQGGSDQFRLITWPVVNIIVAHACPYVVVFACVVMVTTVRVRRRANVERLEDVWKTTTLDAAAAVECHTALLVVCVLYLVLLLPGFVDDVFHFLAEPGGMNLVKHTPSLVAKQRLAATVSSLLFHGFGCVKFTVFLVVSRSFRKRLRAIVLCRRCARVCSHNTSQAVQLNEHDPAWANSAPRKLYATTSV